MSEERKHQEVTVILTVDQLSKLVTELDYHVINGNFEDVEEPGYVDSLKETLDILSAALASCKILVRQINHY